MAERKKVGRKADFFPTLHPIFFLYRAWNPPIFIRGGK